MDNKSLEMLEFPKIKEMLAGFTSFSASRDLALNLQPQADFEEVRLLLRQSAEARHLLSQQPEFSIGEISDIRQAVKMAARGKILEPETLLQIQHTLAAVRQLRRNLGQQREQFPQLWGIARGIVELHQVEKSIASCLAPTGELMDSASPQLAW